MKKLIFPVLSFFSVLSINAQEVRFFEGEWSEAVQMAASKNKMIMLKAYTDWCHWCKVMDKETLTDKTVAKHLNAAFIPVQINFEEKMGMKLAAKFRVRAYPTVLFFNSKGQLVNKVEGYRDAAQFTEDINKSLKSPNSYAFDATELEVEYPEFYLNSFGPRGERESPTSEMVADFLNKQKDPFSEVSWSVMYRFGLTEKLNAMFLRNVRRYEYMYGKAEVTNKIMSIINQMVTRASEKQSEELLQEALDLVDTHLPEEKEMTKLKLNLNYYQSTENWRRVAKLMAQHVETNGYQNASLFNSVCWTIYEDVDDKDIIKLAANWMEEVIKDAPDYYYVDTYAALLYKSGNLYLAEKNALQAIEIGNANEEDVTPTEELLEKIRADLVKAKKAKK